MFRFPTRLSSWAAVPLALLAAACGASPSSPAPPAETAPVVALPPPAAPEVDPPAPEPSAAPTGPAPTAETSGSVVLALQDGLPGTWTGAHGNHHAPIRDVWGTPDLVLAVAGGEVLRSIDRGLTWRLATLPKGVQALSVWGASSDEIWVGGQDLILRSTDRGVTWKTTPVPMNAYFSAFWADDKDVYAVGSDGVLVHSSDRGVTWERQAADLGMTWLYGIWGNGRDVWAVGAGPRRPGHWVDTPGLAHTNDRGKTWKLLPIQSGALRGICGTGDGVMHAIDAGGALHQSSDRGKTWTNVRSFGSVELMALECRGKSEIFVGGRNRTFQRSEDGGKTWADELAAAHMWTKTAFSTVSTIVALPSGEAFVGGEGVFEPRVTGTLFRRR